VKLGFGDAANKFFDIHMTPLSCAEWLRR
jgi:hypothetical protein